VRGGAVVEDLAEWGDQILGVARAALGDQDAVTIVAVGGAAVLRQPSERIIRIRCAAVAGEIARRVVRPADDLIRRVVGVLCCARAVDPRLGPIPDQIVAVAVRRAGAFGGVGQALQTVVAIGEGSRTEA
jgi:hypothetical protein